MTFTKISGCLSVIATATLVSVAQAGANEACLDQLAAAGRKAKTDVMHNDVTSLTKETSVTAPLAATLTAMSAAAAKCLDAAYPSKEEKENKVGKTFVWYRASGATYDYCVTLSPMVQKVGGSNPKYRNQHSVWFRCTKNAPKLPDGMFL